MNRGSTWHGGLYGLPQELSRPLTQHSLNTTASARFPRNPSGCCPSRPSKGDWPGRRCPRGHLDAAPPPFGSSSSAALHAAPSALLVIAKRAGQGGQISLRGLRCTCRDRSGDGRTPLFAPVEIERPLMRARGCLPRSI
ncbi:hypothetical protein HPB50_023460 [Hyalomma asiaticum]|uniref:Uncharacterized protein n=1 Tax=Hyalomma asiaticum TaxID=266040 RepID=A0ACB7TQM5_HYAAI|nr:hypothetical protein HPB50_023460 [Hyalomma asiaticum]